MIHCNRESFPSALRRGSKGDDAIRIIIYSFRYDNWLENMVSWLEGIQGRGALLVCRTPEDLRDALLHAGVERPVVILHIRHFGELEELMALRRHLMRGRVVLVHRDLKGSETGAAYKLNPRFVGHEDADHLQLLQVLGRMMDQVGR